MSVPYPAIAASESKAAFMAGLGLDSRSLEHEQLYKLMKEDAVEQYQRVVQQKKARSPESQQRINAEQRYAYTQIDKGDIQEAISYIYDNASDELKPLYERGRDPEDPSKNWTIRWMLWHIFRYRDGRNKRSPSTSESGELVWRSGAASPAARLLSASPMKHDERVDNATSIRYSLYSAGSASGQGGSARPSRPLPYDPVRG